MTRKLNKTVTAKVTCDACGKEWEEEEPGYHPSQRLKEGDDLCEDCNVAYQAWKAERRKAQYKLP